MNEMNNTPETKGSSSLSDLSNGATPTATPVGMPTPLPKFKVNQIREANIAEVAQPNESDLPVNSFGNPMIDAAFQNLDNAIARTSQEYKEVYQEGLEQRIDSSIDNDIDDEVITSNTSNTFILHTDIDESEPLPPFNSNELRETEPIQPDTVTRELVVKDSAPVSGTVKKNILLVNDEENIDEIKLEKNDEDNLFGGIDDEDLHFLDDEEEDKLDSDDDFDEKAKTEEIRQTIRSEMKSKFNPVKNQIDLNKFKISKKSINASKVITGLNNKAIECADGVIYSQKRAIRMSAFKPMEIQSLDPERLRTGNYNKFMENKLKLIYEHIVDENKPRSFEAWAMTTPNTSVDDYMFTAYKATFGLSNIITFNCPKDKCSNVFMEKVPIRDMIKFENDKVKEEYYNILHSGNTDTPIDKTYDIDLYQVSDDYVFALKTPSLYNTFIEPTLIDRKFMNKYEDLLTIISYIDSVYMIDHATTQLIPINTKPVPNDKAITYMRKIKTFATIIKSLTSDQLQALSVQTDKYDTIKMGDDGTPIKPVTYVYPEKKCPKCGEVIEESELTPDNMLFMRHQLGLMNKI